MKRRLFPYGDDPLLIGIFVSLAILAGAVVGWFLT